MTDWIEHTGDTCPVDPETVVEVRYKGHPTNGLSQARVFLWSRPESQWSVSEYRIVTPAKPPEPEMTGFIATLTDEQKAAALAYCGDDHHGPTKPEPDLIALRLECLKLAVTLEVSGVCDLISTERVADGFLDYVLNGSVDNADA
jgi:hypothetical protein